MSKAFRSSFTLFSVLDHSIDYIKEFFTLAFGGFEVFNNFPAVIQARICLNALNGFLDKGMNFLMRCVELFVTFKMAEYLSAFTVGDQLLWGAAEPLRRMLRILLES